MTTTTFTVVGMTCAHCVGAVESAVRAVPGVTGAVADLATGQLDVTTTGPVDAAAVRAAIADEGYEVEP
jgi:copper chaperone CopZ